MLRRLRGLAFLSMLSLMLVPVVLLIVLSRPAPLRWRFALSNVWTRFFVWCCRSFVGIRLRVRGLENLPGPGCIYYSKHQSAWETLAFQTLFPHYVWILKREALWIPVFGWGLACLEPIAIDRSAGRSAVEQIIRQGRERLQQGLGIMIFPEGTRIAPGRTGRFGLGGAILARATGAPVVPIAHNAGMFWPPRRVLEFHPGVVDVVIGEPRRADDRDDEQWTRELRQWIGETTRELERNAALDEPRGGAACEGHPMESRE